MLRTQVMIDLETMGTGPDAAIVQIGAVAFSDSDAARPVDDWRAETPKLLLHVDLASAVAAGGTIDADTVLWWLRQEEQARNEFKHTAHVLDDALSELSDWWRTYADPEARLWGNGADFDPVILGSAYRRLGYKIPWVRWNVRCFRTLRAEHSAVPYERRGTAHRALDDALSQAGHVLAIRRARQGAVA